MYIRADNDVDVTILVRFIFHYYVGEIMSSCSYERACNNTHHNYVLWLHYGQYSAVGHNFSCKWYGVLATWITTKIHFGFLLYGTVTSLNIKNWKISRVCTIGLFICTSFDLSYQLTYWPCKSPMYFLSMYINTVMSK